MTSTPLVDRATTAREKPATPFRTDIQGLRAVAVGLVLLFHAGVDAVPGGFVGVDVFFVISGFLITGLILREVRSTGRLSLRRFYARRARRLLPATALVFAAVAVLTVLLLPVTRWKHVAEDLAASSLYVVNWKLADRATDYFADGAAASPLQHFWSLAIEEQFYVAWPLLVVLVTFIASRTTRWRAKIELILGASIALILVPSLVWSIYLTETSPGAAYLVTTTRSWELALGAVLAVLGTRLERVPLAVRHALGWLGLGAIVIAALTFSGATPFPSATALLPTLGACAVLVAGAGDGAARPRILDAPVMQDVGALSYSLYLWHWPVLVFAAAIWARDDSGLSTSLGLLAVGFSVVPAYLSYRAVEKPFHQSRWFAARPVRSGILGVVCVVIGLAAATTVWGALARDSGGSDAPATALGAQVLGDDPSRSEAGKAVDSVEAIVPSPVDALDDNADTRIDGCHQDQVGTEPLSCTYGDPDSDVSVVLVGDSHAAHWQPALRAAAEANSWRLDTYTKSACLFADTDTWLGAQDRPYESCREWTANVIETIEDDPPTVVVTSMSGGHTLARDGQRVPRPEADVDLGRGVARAWRSLEAAGATVVTIIDTPWVGIDVPECVASNPDRLTRCAADREQALADSAGEFQEIALAEVPSARAIDLTDYICPQSECAPVIGDVLVWRDGHHLTATYSRSLGPMLADELESILADG